MAAAALRAGADASLARGILDTGTTEEALDLLAEGDGELYGRTMKEICTKCSSIWISIPGKPGIVYKSAVLSGSAYQGKPGDGGLCFFLL